MRRKIEKRQDQPDVEKVPEERKVKNPQKKESQVEANKLQQSRIVKTEANKPQPGKEVKPETNKHQQNEKAEAAVSIKVQTAGKSEERKPRSIVTVQPVQPVDPSGKDCRKTASVDAVGEKNRGCTAGEVKLFRKETPEKKAGTGGKRGSRDVWNES